MLFVGLLMLFAAEAKAAGTADVSLAMAPDGVRATYVLDRAVSRFDFAKADVVRSAHFELRTPGLRLEGDAIVSSKPFRRFDLLVRPMTEERDAKYPAHFRIGSGGVVFAPALVGNLDAWLTRLSLRLSPGEIRLPASGDVARGFVFIGPAALRDQSGGVDLVADPATPRWLIDRSRSALSAGLATFTRALGAPLPRKPLLIVRHQGSERNFRIGDVTQGFVTALRFHGAAWERPDELAGKAIQSFLLHEAFHFWNGGLAQPAEGTATWLHEGAADYAALLGGLENGVLAEADVRRSLGDSLQRCRQAVQLAGDKPLAEMGFLTNQVRYPCGTLLQWAADMHVRRASGGKRTILDVWGGVIRSAAARPEKSYSLENFYAAAGLGNGSAFAPARLLVHTGGPQRWTALTDALEALGADIHPVPSQTSRRFALAFHLLRQSCRSLDASEGFGFWTETSTVRLQSPKGCGNLAGDPRLRSIEGGDPFEMSEETYAAVQRRCARGEAVSILTDEGRTLAAPCAAPLPDAPNDYRVDRRLPVPRGAAP
jgi:hypothetical protein